jgi:RNAse (barnase) inhibitor barstar
MRAVTDFLDVAEPGIYRVDIPMDLAALEREAQARQLRVFQVEGRGASDATAFLEEIARAMSFPEYFGQNWNALVDCLRDLEWAPADGYIIVYKGFHALSATHRQDFEIALSAFEAGIDYWRELGKPMWVLLVNKSHDVPSVPTLSSVTGGR